MGTVAPKTERNHTREERNKKKTNKYSLHLGESVPLLAQVTRVREPKAETEYNLWHAKQIYLQFG